MFLKDFLTSSPKADLQSYHLYWRPESGRESAKEKLASVLFKCMSNQNAVRERFEGLGGSHRAFLISSDFAIFCTINQFFFFTRDARTGGWMVRYPIRSYQYFLSVNGLSNVAGT